MQVTTKDITATVAGLDMVMEMDEQSMIDTILGNLRAGAKVTIAVEGGHDITFTA